MGITKEELRLQEPREQGVPWRKVGAIPQRAAMGEGAGGLQRERRREDRSSQPWC